MHSFTDSRRSGFVLLEAMIALAIISLIAIALLGATAMQVRTADKGALLLTARELADERMATLRSLGYDDLVRLPDSIAAGTFPPPFQHYSWLAESEPVPGENDLFSVGVVVMTADEAFPLHTLLHEPRPQLGWSTAPQQQPAQAGPRAGAGAADPR